MAVPKKVAIKHQNRRGRINRIKKFCLCGTYKKKTREEILALVKTQVKREEMEQ